jgi:hypothetical protein
MQSRLRLNLATRTAFAATLFTFAAIAISQPSHAQTAAVLPKSWNDAVGQLSDKIAAAMSPTKPISLDVKNISSLSAGDAASIRGALEEQLGRHSFKFGPVNTNSGPESLAELNLTLSESVGGYVWVVQILNNRDGSTALPTMIAFVPKVGASDTRSSEEFLSIEKRFIWKQGEKFLDFALTSDSISGDPRLLILGAREITIYKSSDSQWQVARTALIPQNNPPSRDLEGAIRRTEFTVGNLNCVMGADSAVRVDCKVSQVAKPSRADLTISGLFDTVSTLLQGTCHERAMSLGTGEGDWTQGDTVQGYLASTASVASPSGTALEFEGPVLSLEPNLDLSSARAIVHNLKTGNYEAYVVTATCSH